MGGQSYRFCLETWDSPTALTLLQGLLKMPEPVKGPKPSEGQASREQAEREGPDHRWVSRQWEWQGLAAQLCTRTSALLSSVLTPASARDSCFTFSCDHFTQSLVLPSLVYFLSPHPCSVLLCPALFSSHHLTLSSSAALLAG